MHAGSTDQTDNSQGQRIEIEEVFLFPDYDHNLTPINHDIALIYLSEPLVFNDKVQPIRFAHPCNINMSDLAPGQPTSLTGWGKLSLFDYQASQFLMNGMLAIISVDEANLINESTGLPSIPEIPQHHLTLYQEGVQQSSGDSGGPYIIDKEGDKIQIGIVSYSFVGPGPPEFTAVSVATNVLDYSDWIEDVTGTAQNESGVDLYSKDRPWDLGYEPSNVPFQWASEDIWIRNQNDGLINQTHQNPQYGAMGSRYIYVRVRNRGCEPSIGSEQLTLNWGKASTAMYWPMYWNGSLTTGQGGLPLGGLVGSQTIPPIAPGSSVILTFPWPDMPDPSNYQGLNEEPWHFCLLSRIISDDDPMSSPETILVGNNTLLNNNIAWKNFTIINFLGELEAEYLRVDGGSISVGGETGQTNDYDFILTEESTEIANLWRECEIILKLDETLWQKWDQGGRLGSGIEVFKEPERWLKVVSDPASINNIQLNSGEYVKLGVQFGFLTREATSRREYKYHIMQKESASGTIIGGELFKLTKPNPERSLFYSNAGSVGSVKPNEPVELSAFGIGEPADYNWYDASGGLLFEGQQNVVQSDSNMVLRLEVIAESDGFKDYHEFNLDVLLHYIESIYPNPASEVVNINFSIDENQAVQAGISFLHHNTNNTFTFPIEISSQSANIDLSSLPLGTYTITLLIDGAPAHSLQFLKN